MDKVCVGCGLCEAMCHKRAIRITENHEGSLCDRNLKLCDNCGVCYKTCPVEQLREKDELSRVDKVVIGRSQDKDVITASASGGIVSEILIHLFKSGEIDAAIVAHYDRRANIYGDVIENVEEVLKHSGSYYHTSKQLINIKKIEQYNKVAVVGLPCHIEGAMNYCKFTKQMDKVITIALFCTTGRTYEGFRRFFKRETGFDVSKGNIKKYLSRYGDKKLIRIEDDKGNIYECPDEKYKFTMDFFWTNKTCLECRKMYGLSADISVGDAWHRVKRNGDKMEKLAIVAANTNEGCGILDMVSDKLDIEQIDNGIYELIISQKYGAGLKLICDDKILTELKAIRKLRQFNTMRILRSLNFRLRNQILMRLERNTMQLAEKAKQTENYFRYSQ